MTPQTTVVMDPPWNETGGGKSKRGADAHYPTMKKSDIARLLIHDSPLYPDRSGCSLWMWSTMSSLPDSMWLMAALGARYVTHAVWVKAYDVSVEVSPPGLLRTVERGTSTEDEAMDVVVPQAPGLGQRLRACHELLLYGRWGMTPVPAPADRMPSVFYAPRGEHSEKPQIAYDLIERHDGITSRRARAEHKPDECLEMFARKPRDGWTVWGNEVTT